MHDISTGLSLQPSQPLTNPIADNGETKVHYFCYVDALCDCRLRNIQCSEICKQVCPGNVCQDASVL